MHAFQEFKAKDLRADFLVWVRFGRRFNLGQGPIEIAILSNPSRFIPDACRLDTAQFEKRVGSSDSLRILSFDSLEALLPYQLSNSGRLLNVARQLPRQPAPIPVESPRTLS